MSILEKILANQNRNFCQIFVSATTGRGATFNPNDEISEITVRYVVGEHSTAMTKVNKLMFEEGYYFSSADLDNQEYVFIKAKSQ